MHSLLVSAAHKSSGKTTVAIGLAAALRARGLCVQPFKKGPDYIDPLWLSAAAGRTCRNLDLYLSSPAEVTDAFAMASSGADVALVEGNKGLYDGLSLDGSNSNAAVARLLDLPVVLVLDSRGMTRGIAPLILGYQAFDREVRITGVILNRLGGSRHESKLRAVIEHYTDVPVLGALQEDAELSIQERHLGLMPAGELAQSQAHIDRLAKAITGAVDLDRVLVRCGSPDTAPIRQSAPLPPPDLKVGIARDRAFGFYYAEDLEAFERAGAQLVFFDALNDAHLPPVDALFIGGGFPEVLAPELTANRSLLADIRAAVEAGLPAYVECGGLMYLARSISWRNVTYPMVGAIAADVVMQERPVGRGYVHLRETEAIPWPNRKTTLIKAHEFHHSTLRNIDPGLRFAFQVQRGHGIDGEHDGVLFRNTLASYSHLRSTAGHDWPARFVAFARSIKCGRPVQTAGHDAALA
jgi:cobyrinic acid a,c-diamide synthase